MSSAAARSGTAAKGFVGARWWGKPRGEPNVGVLPADDTFSRMSEQKQQGRPHQLRCSSPAALLSCRLRLRRRRRPDARGRRQLELTGSTAGCSTESAREGKLARRSREPNVGKLGQSDMWEATRRDKSLPSARCS
jgi:hypothetical protein